MTNNIFFKVANVRNLNVFLSDPWNKLLVHCTEFTLKNVAVDFNKALGAILKVLVFSPSGPGLAIRILCGDEPYQGNDYAETNIILGQIVDFVTAVKKVCEWRFVPVE